MKAIPYLLLVFTFAMTIKADAQFFKKIAKKAQQTAERTLEKKVEEKTEKETSNIFDSTLNKNEGAASGTINASAKTPSNFYFDYQFKMLMENDKKASKLDYLFSSNGEYFATKIPDKNGANNSISVIDFANNKMHMFMENKGKKSLMSTKLNMQKQTDKAIEATNYKIVETGNTKKILGYSCKEYKVSGTNLEGTVWVTAETGLNLYEAMPKVKIKQQNGLEWMSAIKGVPLLSVIVDTSRKKPKTITTKCIAVDKINVNIVTSAYQKINLKKSP